MGRYNAADLTIVAKTESSFFPSCTSNQGLNRNSTHFFKFCFLVNHVYISSYGAIDFIVSQLSNPHTCMCIFFTDFTVPTDIVFGRAAFLFIFSG